MAQLRKAIIGARSDIENVPIERLRAFYRHYYQPDNAVLLISGKLEEPAALRLAQKNFGRIPRPSRALRATYTVEPTQDGERSVTLRRAGDVQIVSAPTTCLRGPMRVRRRGRARCAAQSRTLGPAAQGARRTGLTSSVFGTERQQREAGFAYFGASLGQNASLEAARDALLRVLEGFAKPRSPKRRSISRAGGSSTTSSSRSPIPAKLTSVLSEYAASATGASSFCTATG